MSTGSTCALLITAAQGATQNAGTVDSAKMQHVLSTIDQALFGAAVALVVCIFAWWWLRARRDPLENAPLRPNQLREDAVAVALLAYLGAAVIISGFVRLAGGQTESVLTILVVGNGAHLAGIAACLVVGAIRFQGGVRRFLLGAGGPRPTLSIALVLALTVMAFGLCPMIRDAAMSLILYLAPDHEFASHPTIEALHERPQPIAVVIALWGGAVVVAPVAEELFFRGLVQTLLVGVLRNRWLAIALGAIVFGAVHYSQVHAVGALVLLGLLIGYAYERTGSLIPPIAIHAAFNLKTLVWDALSR
jgi:membrane protease YdiL (CAAX protease family)